jgi:phage terminase large subunit
MFVRTTAINKILALTKRVKAIKGGSSAGKTYGVLPILIDKAIKTPELRISVVSETIPHLKKGAIRDFKKIMKSTNRWNKNHWHSTDSIYSFSNGSYIEFFSADIESKLRGPRRDILYVNECNGVDFEPYRQAAKRTELEIFLDWNPTSLFWFDTDISQDADVDFITLTYLDNEAAPQSAIDDILKSKLKGFFNSELPVEKLFEETNIKSTYWANDYKVYGLGLTGRLEGTVFPNWIVGTFDESLPYCHGLDFGFNPDPCGLIKVAVDQKNKKIYVEEKAYLQNLGTDDIEKLLRDRVEPSGLIMADSAGKITIHDLRQRGLSIQACVKGSGSIIAGLKKIMDYKLIVCGPSPNLKTELNNYIWNDKKAGIPIDKFNHLIDPLRYAFDRLIRGGGGML